MRHLIRHDLTPDGSALCITCGAGNLEIAANEDGCPTHVHKCLINDIKPGIKSDCVLCQAGKDISRKPGQVVFDEIEKPAHYNYSSIEPIDVIEAWKLDYTLGCCVKYIGRHEHKGTALKDLKKAKWYLERKIKQLEKAAASGG